MQEAAKINSERDELAGLRGAMAAAGDVAYVWELLTDRITWLSGADEAFGIDTATHAASGHAFNDHIDPEDLAFRVRAIAALGTGNTHFECEYRLRLPQFGERWVHDRGRADISFDGRAIRITGVIRFMDLNRSRDGRHDFLANYDSLTGHFNRARLREALDHALYFTKRYKVSGAFLVVGVDKLTLVNQALGHETADEVLLAIGDRLDRCLRASDVIGRVGGDKFGAVLSNIPDGDLEAATEKILDAVRHTPVETRRGPVYVTVSIGAVTFPGPVNTAQDVMMRADASLLKAKQSGRDCAATYDYCEEQLQQHRNSIVVAEQVQRALREDRLHFAYQPIVDAVTHEPVFHECLLRMIEPDGQVIVAGSFMPIVEDLGMIRTVDRTVLERAIEELAIYPQARVSINVSGLTTTDRSWMRSALAMLRGRPDIAERIVVEITETAGLEDLEACCRFVKTLRDLGCEVALDDFGAGYTSFRHLKQLAVNKVKIDGSFIRNLGQNPDNLVFVRTLIDLARNFSLETVGECVETEEEARILVDEGIDYLQGYLFGRPDLRAPWTSKEEFADSRIPRPAGVTPIRVA